MTLFMNMSAVLTPIAQPQIYIGVDLADGDVTLEKYVKYAFVQIWAMSLTWLTLELITEIFL